MRAKLVVKLACLSAGRDLSPEAEKRLDYLLEQGTADEIEQAIAHLRHLPKVRAEAIDVDPATMAAFEKEIARHTAEVEAHRKRLGAAAVRLGRQVAAHEMTLADAHGRLQRLAARPDPQWSIPDPLVRSDEAYALIEEAFSRGFHGRPARPDLDPKQAPPPPVNPRPPSPTEHAQRAAAHRDTLGGTAFRLGQAVTRGETTVETAQRRLDQLSARTDPETGQLLVSADEADRIILDAYARGRLSEKGGK